MKYLDTIIFDLLKKEQLLELVEKCRDKVELVMTGINAPAEFIKLADYVTEFVQIKHPYYRGAQSSERHRILEVASKPHLRPNHCVADLR